MLQEQTRLAIEVEVGRVGDVHAVLLDERDREQGANGGR